MRENFIKLLREFNVIRDKGYIRGIYNSSSSIGRTFEQELGLVMNKRSEPDYNGIEIKTRRFYTRSLVNLFSAVLDGTDCLELNRLKEKYGYPYYRDREYKCLYAEVYANKRNYGGRYYKYKLDIDYNVKKIYLCVYNFNGSLAERKIFWSFEYIREKLENKLSYLAMVMVHSKKMDNWNYFRYSEISFYKLIGFDTFLNLLVVGKIRLTIKIDIYLDSDNYGKTYDHGCSFSIPFEYLTELFYCYDVDTGLYI